MTGRKNIILVFCLLLTGLSALCGCGRPVSDSLKNAAGKQETGSNGLVSERGNSAGKHEMGLQGLVYERSMELQYAENFSVDYYEGGYKLLKTKDGTEILIVPEGKEALENPDGKRIVLNQPVKNLYLVSSAVMDMFDQLDALDGIGFSGQKKENWYVENAKKAMEKGDILYAGKYNKPDYELIVSGNCSLAIENRMISHSPEVVEMLEQFGIPVMTEYSSFESHPLGRVEWVKFFGALVDKEEKAEELFGEQISVLDKVTAHNKTNANVNASTNANVNASVNANANVNADANTLQAVAFFFITSNGLVQVRQSSDYIPKMIELAGGKYIFENLGDPESGRSTINMQVEEFYNGAKDADFLIYNSSIDGGVDSLGQLLEKCPVLKDFKAVKAGNVWCTTNDMYQQSMSMGGLLEDMHQMLQGEGEDDMKYLFTLK